MSVDLLRAAPHRRLNPLTREWVLVSPHRMARPWQGKVEAPSRPAELQYDPQCYLCPGNTRAGAAQNPRYTGTFVFDNDFAALVPGAPAGRIDERGLMVAEAERGICRVVCFSPRHDLTLSRMSAGEVRRVVEVWTEQFRALAAMEWIQHVQIFENRGELMGCSNPHPHGQIWANQSVPNEALKETRAQRDYAGGGGACLLCDYLALESRQGERIVCENDGFAALAPFWAVWPFETLVVSKQHVSGLDLMDDGQRAALADILRRLMIRYDNLFQVSFPYSLGLHQRPTDGEPHPEWHFHAHFYPPLLRSASVRKFMVGYEMLAEPQRDLTPEAAAERLRALSETHFLDTPRGSPR